MNRVIGKFPFALLYQFQLILTILLFLWFSSKDLKLSSFHLRVSCLPCNAPYLHSLDAQGWMNSLLKWNQLYSNWSRKNWAKFRSNSYSENDRRSAHAHLHMSYSGFTIISAIIGKRLPHPQRSLHTSVYNMYTFVCVSVCARASNNMSRLLIFFGLFRYLSNTVLHFVLCSTAKQTFNLINNKAGKIQICKLSLCLFLYRAYLKTISFCIHCSKIRK